MCAAIAPSRTAFDDAPQAETEGGAGTYLTFVLAGQIFAVPVSHVREILDLQTISRLPNAPGDLVGGVAHTVFAASGDTGRR